MTTVVAITGNTYPVKDQLRALGGRWNPDAKAWMVPSEKADAAQRLVGSAVKQPSRFIRSGPVNYAKRCWECGCRFTWADAKRNGGEWRDSYCGC